MEAVRRGHAGSCGVVSVTEPVEEYLRQLRASLRTRPEETSRILAEAEDHLRESVAAGRAAGLAETEAAEAAISSFGTVRAVARAHQAARGKAVGALAGLFMALWLLAGAVLTAVFAVVITVVIVAEGAPGERPSPGPSPGGLALSACRLRVAGLAQAQHVFPCAPSPAEQPPPRVTLSGTPARRVRPATGRCRPTRNSGWSCRCHARRCRGGAPCGTGWSCAPLEVSGCT